MYITKELYYSTVKAGCLPHALISQNGKKVVSGHLIKSLASLTGPQTCVFDSRTKYLH